MRNIDEIMAQRFYAGETSTLSNTKVQNYEMYLFGNRIAWIYNDVLYFTLCGWNTLTTRSRLQGLGINIKQKKGKLYFNDEEINDHEVYEMNL